MFPWRRLFGWHDLVHVAATTRWLVGVALTGLPAVRAVLLFVLDIVVGPIVFAIVVWLVGGWRWRKDRMLFDQFCVQSWSERSHLLRYHGRSWLLRQSRVPSRRMSLRARRGHSRAPDRCVELCEPFERGMVWSVRKVPRRPSEACTTPLWRGLRRPMRPWRRRGLNWRDSGRRGAPGEGQGGIRLDSIIVHRGGACSRVCECRRRGRHKSVESRQTRNS